MNLISSDNHCISSFNSKYIQETNSIMKNISYPLIGICIYIYIYWFHCNHKLKEDKLSMADGDERECVCVCLVVCCYSSYLPHCQYRQEEREDGVIIGRNSLRVA